MKLSISEIINTAAALPSKQEKINFLKANDSMPVRQMLRVMYDPKVEWLLPDSPPPWKKNSYNDVEGMFYKETRRLRLFLKGGGYDQHYTTPQGRVKFENLFISLLQDIDNNDADLLAFALTKKPVKGLTEATLLAAYPGLFETKLA